MTNKHNAELGTTIILAVLIVLFIGIGLFSGYRNYKECKQAGFTTFYCLTTNG